MSKYFRKFDCVANLSHPDLIKLKGHNSFNFVSGNSAIRYNKIKNPILLARDIFPNKIFRLDPHLIFYAEVDGPGLLDPHRDHGSTTVANFYFESNNSTTNFYKEKPGTKPITYQGTDEVSKNNVYNVNDLELESSFQAQDGDCYLLNVSEIHGVHSEKQGTRKFINMQWFGPSIEDVYNSIIR